MSRVLVAEDDPHILRVVSLWLNRQGHEVIEARNGIQALELFERQPPDVLVTDINMPGLTGLELLDRIRELGGADIGVVVLTNRWDHREIGEQLNERGARVIPKPFSPNELAKVVSEMASRSAGAAPSGRE